MKVENMRKLLKLLGEENAKKYMNVDNRKIESIILALHKTYISSMLSPIMLNKFCDRIIKGDYGEVYVDVLAQIGKIPITKENLQTYRSLLTEYMNTGYNTEKKYRELLDRISKQQKNFNFDFDYEAVKLQMEKEIQKAKSKTTVEKFLNNGGSLEELVTRLDFLQIEEFNEHTTIEEEFSYQVKIPEIGFLVSKISNLSLDKETEAELLETYYAGLEQNKSDGFASVLLTVRNKPRLFKLLNKQCLSVLPMETVDKCKKKRL